MDSSRKFISLIVVLFFVVNGQAQVTVSTPFGSVSGFSSAGVDAFLGIPYALPPVGPLRWKSPQINNFGAVNASKYGSDCVQLGSFSTQSSAAQEDCLFLNIWRPQGSPSNLPVKVFIHGGGFTAGAGRLYVGSALANLTNSIVVTINYRLGLFGFWACSALMSESTALNYGLQDQQFALKWVQAAIASFGGDASNVLIFGESAGGSSVLLHMFMPGSAPLFSKVISESPGPWRFVPLNEALYVNDATMPPSCKSVSQPAQQLSCLRALNTSTVVASTHGFPLPVVDQVTLLAQPYLLFSGLKSASSVKPLLIGSNQVEGNIFAYIAFGGVQCTEQQFNASQSTLMAESSFSNQTAMNVLWNDYVQMGPNVGWWQAASACQEDEYITCGATYAAAQVQSVAGATVYSYRFDHASANWDFTMLNATHGVELAYVFQQPIMRTILTAQELQLSTDLIAYFDSFHRYGSPSKAMPNLPHWPLYDSNSISVMTFEVGRNYQLVEADSIASPLCPAWRSAFSW